MSLLQVLTAFTPGCLAAGEYTNASRRLVYPLERVADDDQSMVCGQAECNPSVFVFAMLRIIQGDSFGVREDRGGQLKADAVFLYFVGPCPGPTQRYSPPQCPFGLYRFLSSIVLNSRYYD